MSQKSFSPSTPLLSILIFILALLSPTCSQYCHQPQKGYYMSYNAISKRDTMPQLFTLINSKIAKYNISYANQKNITFSITDLHPQMYYNEHHQKEVYLDPQHVNVTLGDVQFAFRMNYSVKNSGSEKKGWARGRVLVDQTAYFIKRLMIKDGYLEWDPTQIVSLTITFPISIQYSEPTLEYDDKMQFQLILNDHVGESHIKSQILNDFNNAYKVLLKDHLNNEEVIGNMTYKYNYKNIAFSYLNVIKNYTLSNTQWKGLQAYFFFQLQNNTFNCTPDINVFDFDYFGGNQQYYSLTTITESFRYALNQGLLDVRLDRKWQVPTFQFYMGDLANSVPYANNFQPDDAFDVECRWDKNRTNAKVVSYSTHQVYASAGQICTVSYKAKQIIEFEFDISFVVKIVAEDDTLKFTIQGSNIFGAVYRSLDPNFVVKDPNFARYSIAQVVYGISGSTTLGTGFKIGKRKFPSSNVTPTHLIVFDASES